MLPDNDLIEEHIEQSISIFDTGQLPSVFRDVDEDDFGEVDHAVEQRSSYDGDWDDEEEEDDDISVGF